MNLESKKTVFYDGSCGMCLKSIQFLMDADHSGVLYYAPLQGETAKAHLPDELIQEGCLSTLVYRQGDGSLFLRSEAIATLLIDLGGFHRILGKLIKIVPLGIREAIYRWVARHRKKLFSKSECRMPTVEERKRMLS